MPVLVAPAAFGGALRAPVVAAAIGRGLERASVTPLPSLCPVSSGGAGTIEVLLPALGGEAVDGFAVVEDGGTAIVEAASSSGETGLLVARAAATGAAVVVVCAGAGACDDGGAGAVAAIGEAGGLGGATLVVLCDVRAAWGGAGVAAGAAGAGERRPAALDTSWLRRDPRGVAMTAAGGGLAGALWSQYDARLVSGPAFVLEALDVDARMRASRAVVVGEGRLDRGTLAGRACGEIATRARQSGVPCHAVVGERALDRFDARILDLQAVFEASSVAEIEAAGEALAEFL